MSGKKDTKNIEVEESINTLKHCFPYLFTKFNECVSKLPEDVRSNDENLRALFKTMWTINMLIKSVLGDDAVTHIEQNIQVDESSIDLRSSLNEVYTIMRELNSLFISEFHSDT